MMYENSIFSSMVQPLPNMFPRHISLFIKDDLTILSVNGALAETYFSGLEPGNSIASNFDMGGIRRLSEALEGKNFFPTLPRIRLQIAIEPFYTAFPFASLRIEKLQPDLFFGSISISNLFPNFFPERHHAMIYSNQAGLLLGFNEGFFKLFSQVGGSAENFLEQPLSDFINPTPQEIQEKMVREDKRNNFHDFVETLAVSEWCGREWQNGTGQNMMLMAPLPQFSKPMDILIELKCRQIHGTPPLLSLGYSQGRYAPDDTGYLAGTGHTPLQTVIKKSGLALASGSGHIITEGAALLRFCQSGQSLFYYQDDHLLCAYHDPLLFTGNPVRMGLALRDGASCIIEKAVVRAAPKKDFDREGGTSPVIATIGVRPVRYFHLNRFHNLSLSSHYLYADVAGYFLQDVTDLQQTISKLSIQYRRKLTESESLKRALRERNSEKSAFLGVSPATETVRAKALLIAPSRATVLIHGATGTGKEVLAKFIHQNSAFHDGPFVKVDCSVLPKELIESELFGHEKGAFTGAIDRKAGKFEQAEGGTLFLDEIGNLTPATQIKLLHFLQDFTITRVGGMGPIALHLRIIAAANTPLLELVAKGIFREDLYYRLCVMTLQLPPLRERSEDLPVLCEYYLERFALAAGRPVPHLSREAYLKLRAHAWPGNIRELTNVIQRALIFCKGDEITPEFILFEDRIEAQAAGSANPALKSPRTLLYSRKEDIEEVLRKHRGNMNAARRELKVSQRALYYYVEREKIDLRKLRTGEEPVKSPVK